MLNHDLRHEFRTGVCCGIGVVLATAEALGRSFSAEKLPIKYEVEIQRIESHLGALLEEFNRIVDDFNGSAPIDFELADRNYQRGVREWRGSLDRLLGTANHVLAAFPGADNPEVQEMLALLRQFQQGPVSTLKELRDKWYG